VTRGQLPQRAGSLGLNGSGAVLLSVLFHSILEQHGLAQDTPTPQAEGHVMQISHSDSQAGPLAETIRCAHIHTATTHTLKRTLVNPLCQPKKLISEYIHKKSTPNIHRQTHA